MKPRFVTEGDGYSDFNFCHMIESGPTSTEFQPSLDLILILFVPFFLSAGSFQSIFLVWFYLSTDSLQQFNW